MLLRYWSRQEAGCYTNDTSNDEDYWRGIPAFSYIGVSKLSCRPCNLWIKCHNELSPSKFYTRGCHGKWYWPWGLPKSSSVQLVKDLIEMMNFEYTEHCRTKDIFTGTTDSTDADTEDRDITPPSSKEQLSSRFLGSQGRCRYQPGEKRSAYLE